MEYYPKLHHANLSTNLYVDVSLLEKEELESLQWQLFSYGIGWTYGGRSLLRGLSSSITLFVIRYTRTLTCSRGSLPYNITTYTPEEAINFLKYRIFINE